MAKINFRKFGVYTGISRKEKQTGDAREEFADIIYRTTGGIKGHALALKIYGSKGEEEYTDEETGLIRSVAERYCLPGFIDGLYEQLEQKEE